MRVFGGRRGPVAVAAVAALLAAVPMAGAAGAGAAAGPVAGPVAGGGFEVVHDRTYKVGPCAGSTQERKLDSYLPTGTAGPTAAVVWVHGGGFVKGDKSQERIVAIAEDLARRGWAVFSVNYCLPQEGPGFPVEPQDVRDAVRWVTANAGSLNVDADRLATWGGSAGANLAVQVAARLGTAEVAATAGWSGPYDFTDPVGWSEKNWATGIKYLGCDPRDAGCVPTAEAASPVHAVDGDRTPPTFLAGSVGDPVVPSRQQRLMDAALTGAGVPHRSLLVAGTAHSTALTEVAYCPTVAFLETYLGPTTGGPCVPPES